MLTQCCLSLGWHRERKDLLALSFKNKNFKLNKKRLAHKNSYNTAWIFTADVNSAYSKWQDQFSVQGFAPLHGKLPADPCDWRSGLLCFPMTYVSQEAHVHRPVPEAASLKASKSPAPWLHGHKHIKKLIHGLSRLTMLPHTNIHVCVYIYIYIFKESNRCHWVIIRKRGWEHKALLLLPCEFTPQHYPWKISSHSCQLHQSSTQTLAIACLCYCPRCCRYRAPENQPGTPSFSVQTWTVLSQAKTVSALFTSTWWWHCDLKRTVWYCYPHITNEK